LVYTSNVQEEDGLRDLTIRLLNAREEERSRVARELHDDLSQRMALLSIRLAQIVPMIEGRSDVRRRLHFVQKDAQEIATDIHRLSYKLHPSKLDYLGLSAAIGGLCQEVNATGKPAVEFHEQGSIADLPKEVTLCVFRIAQEALRNCAKHSGAKLARVTLVNTGKGTRLSVSDNGCGFEIKPETMESGLGFTSMRERLRIVGGTLTVRSQPARGTSIDVSIPLMWSTF
jgi:signal transduction histidine kinase